MCFRNWVVRGLKYGRPSTMYRLVLLKSTVPEDPSIVLSGWVRITLLLLFDPLLRRAYYNNGYWRVLKAPFRERVSIADKALKPPKAAASSSNNEHSRFI